MELKYPAKIACGSKIIIINKLYEIRIFELQMKEFRNAFEGPSQLDVLNLSGCEKKEKSLKKSRLEQDNLVPF